MRKTTALRAALTGDNRYYRTLSFERDPAAWFKSFAENFERDRLAGERVTLMGAVARRRCPDRRRDVLC